MNIRNRHSIFKASCRIVLGFAMMMAGLGCEPEGAPPRTDEEPVSAVRSAVTAGGTTATVAIYTQWSDGYCANVVVKNEGSTATSSWTVRLNIGVMTTSTVWNANGAKSGTTLTLTNVSQNGSIPPQGTTSAGYCAQGASPIVIPTVITGDSGSLIWPNAISSANSDPWLAQHHDEITEMHPKAVIINFANRSTPAAVKDRWDLMAYDVQTLANLTQQFGNGPNGGAWQLYLFQSTPGYGSHASTDDGVHIKNFWPYLYY